MTLVRLEAYIAVLLTMAVPVLLPAVGAAQAAAGMTGAAAGIAAAQADFDALIGSIEGK